MYLIGSVMCQAIADRNAALPVPIDTDTKLHPYTDATRILNAKPQVNNKARSQSAWKSILTRGVRIPRLKFETTVCNYYRNRITFFV